MLGIRCREKNGLEDEKVLLLEGGEEEEGLFLILKLVVLSQNLHKL